MKRIHFLAGATGTVGGLLSASCGGSRGRGFGGSGRVVVTVRWPQTRAIPEGTRSIRLKAFSLEPVEAGLISQTVAARPQSQLTLESLPSIQVRLEATAHSDNEGNSASLATGDATLRIRSETTENVSIELRAEERSGKLIFAGVDTAGSAGAQIFRVNSDGSEFSVLTPPSEIITHYSWPDVSRDGTQIVFMFGQQPVGAPQTIAMQIMNIDGSNRRTLLHPPSGELNGPTFSPDGTQIAFASRLHKPDGNPESDLEIYVMDASGANIRRLTNNNLLDGCPAWSPDGTRVAFCNNENNRPLSEERNQNIRTINIINGDKAVPASETGRQILSIRWSPDGSKIAFTGLKSPATNRFALLMVDASGGTPTDITPEGMTAQYVSWSPDSRHLALVGIKSGGEKLFTLRPDGGDLQQVPLPDTLRVFYRPCWISETT